MMDVARDQKEDGRSPLDTEVYIAVIQRNQVVHEPKTNKRAIIYSWILTGLCDIDNLLNVRSAKKGKWNDFLSTTVCWVYCISYCSCAFCSGRASLLVFLSVLDYEINRWNTNRKLGKMAPQKLGSMRITFCATIFFTPSHVWFLATRLIKEKHYCS